jgi:hypothetical protein
MEEQQQEHQLDNFFNISFDAAAREHLKSITSWAKICAICAFVGYAISLVVTFFGTRTYASASSSDIGFSTYLRAGRSPLGTLLMVILFGIINYFLFRFSIDARRGLDSMDTVKLNEGLGSLRTYFKVYGIIVVIVLGIVALAFIVALLSIAFANR